MEELKKHKLGDLCVFQEGYVNPSQGIAKYFNGNIKWIRAIDLNNGKVFNTTRTLTDEGFKSAGKSAMLFKPGTIVLSKSGTIGRLGLIQDFMCGNRATINIAPKNNTNILYIFYNLLSRQDEIANLAVGSVQKNLYVSILEQMDIMLPSESIQKKTVELLSSIDDKIEINNRINHNLEEQAQALYKSWFVDFEPFKDGKFVESEMGLIPEGWRVGILSELGDIVAGGTPSKTRPDYYIDHGIAWLTPKDLSIKCNKFTARGEIDITETGYKSSSAKLMPKGSVLFSSRAPIGYITIAKNDICTNQGFKSVVPTYAGTAYIYYWLLSNTENIEAQASGSTFKEASGALMKSFPALVPPKDILKSFEKELKPILRKQELIEEESSNAEQMRDILLPRLMSGEFVFDGLTC